MRSRFCWALMQYLKISKEAIVYISISLLFPTADQGRIQLSGASYEKYEV
jgi:hypothetical protein